MLHLSQADILMSRLGAVSLDPPTSAALVMAHIFTGNTHKNQIIISIPRSRLPLGTLFSIPKQYLLVFTLKL